MIIEWLMGIASGVVDWFATLFPVLDLPPELVHLDQSFNQLFAMGDGLGAFVPWQLIGLIAALPLAIWAVGLTLRAARAVFAHMPFVGGRG